MKLWIYSHFNKKTECFTQPVYSDIEPDKYSVQERRFLVGSDELKVIVPFKNLDLRILGQFDDETGVILPAEKVESLLDCSDIVMDRLSKETGKEIKDVESVSANRA